MNSGAAPPAPTDLLAPWRDDPAALVPVRVTPRARIESVEPATTPDGAPALRVRVRAAPEKGQANEAVVAAIAKAAGVPRASLSVVRGLSSRDKLLRWTR